MDVRETEVDTYIIEDTDVGERIDRWLPVKCDVSRSHIQNAILSGKIMVNGRTVKPNYNVKQGDVVTVEQSEPQPVDLVPENIPLDILYEDKDLLIVNKPKGMVVHPAPGHESGTLVNAVMYHCGNDLSGINGELRPGIVHRIDKDTTGALVVCKNDATHTALAELLKDHSITRRYVGIVIGHLPQENGVVSAPIGRDPKDRKKMCVTERNSRHAVTHYKVLERFKDYDYVEFTLETGRTHQIRVHMKHIGHPILGDAVYGPAKCPFRLEGQTLHARDIGFIHPATGEYIEAEAPLPPYFTHLLEIL